MTATRERPTPAPPIGTYPGMPAFPKAAKGALHNQQLRRDLKHATTVIRSKRAIRASEVRNWEELKVAGEQTKNHLGWHLDQYPTQAEKAITAVGITVRWARNAEEANKIVIDLIRSKGTNEVVKIKSMAAQETDFNEALEDAGTAAWETDLAELIVQLSHGRPSHTPAPATHRNRSEVREVFKEEMGLWGAPVPDGISDNPPELAGVARTHLCEKPLHAKVTISDGNFIVVGTGLLVIVGSEGSGCMCLTLPGTLISVVGIEKLVPTWEDLKAFLRSLPRNSAGERMNPYTSTQTGVTPGDGPQDLHAVLLDNGRVKVLSNPVGREVLRYICCSACMNVYPVYERIGGHTYDSAYPGPTGATLTPQLRGIASKVDKSPPYASNFCGAYNDVCPVKTPISDILVHTRNKVVQKKTTHRLIIESVIFRLADWIMACGCNLAFVQFFFRLAGRIFKKCTHFSPMSFPAFAWSRPHDLPVSLKESLRKWWAKREKEEASK